VSSTLPSQLAKQNGSTNAVATNQFAYRLSNTPGNIDELSHNQRAILLENALIDTARSLNLPIPARLRATGDPGAYIVQARGPIGGAFRAALAAAGAEIVSYIPNNAYLVRLPASGAGRLTVSYLVESVIPYEPYYKVQSSLLAYADKGLPAGAELTLGLFNRGAAATEDQLQKLGATIVSRDSSPFGPIVRVTPPADWTALAQLPGVQIVERSHRRIAANDLSRVTTGVAIDTVTNANYLNLSGSNVLVAMSDSGVDVTHPDFSVTGSAQAPGTVPPVRVIGDSPLSLVDTNGHGTFIAGIIAGNGSQSQTVTNAQGSVTNADFRGKAPAAMLYSIAAVNNAGDGIVSDRYLQAAPALTNALISNNSYNLDGDNAYDLTAAGYDAAVRDALPLVTGSQPVLFVFPAGNAGGGNDDGSGGGPDTILSPATAKNVITVGALEQLRNITNVVTVVANGTTNSSAFWAGQTDSSSQVAGYSSRGNVGIGTEGTFGRYKPDVVAPGTFVISTRSSMWDTNAYFNPTNHYFNTFANQVVDTNSLSYYPLSIPLNAVGVDIRTYANKFSKNPFPTNMPIYVSLTGFPDPTDPTTYDILTRKDEVMIPPDNGGQITSIQPLQGAGIEYAVGNPTNISISYDLTTEITTTNDLGDYYGVYHALDDGLGGFYRYESGTSMAAAEVSGVLALLQDYFTNALHLTPSPVLLKAMLVNGARPVGNYKFTLGSSVNFQGWGLINLPTTLPPGMTNTMANVLATNAPIFFLDQNPTNALATGDSHSFNVTISSNATVLPFRVTLVWTDPPGNPAAAIKLVNNLDLVVSNTATGDSYFGNDIAAGNFYNSITSTNAFTNGVVNLDYINNVENVFVPPLLGSNYVVTVIARSVNVNAVTAQTNNTVQDFALVISSGDSEVTNAFTVTDNGIVSNPTGDQQVTIATTNNVPFFNQIAGASTPLLGTNSFFYKGLTNEQITIGMTNQWHFYIVTNTFAATNSAFKNAAFITFIPSTLAVPRMGVFADSQDNPTRAEADVDIYVSTDPTLTNLNIMAVSNCVSGTQIGASSNAAPTVFRGAALGRNGTEFVADTNSQASEVYYVAVKSESANAAEYGFISVFSDKPFSSLNSDNSQTVNGLTLPVIIPDGTPAHPGLCYTFALALYPMEMENVIVTNIITHQNFGDLIGVLNHSGKNSILNNHRSLGTPPGPYQFVYDDSSAPLPGSQLTDGPGSLNIFTGQQATGPWLLTEADDSLTQTGRVDGLTLRITPHTDPRKGINITLQPGQFYTTYIDVPVGYTNLTVFATNLPPTSQPPIELFVKQGVPPTLADTNNTALLTNCASGTYPTGTLPGNFVSVGPPLAPGRYYIGLFNPDLNNAHNVYLIATLGFSAAAADTIDYPSGGPTLLLDDAVTYSSVFVTDDRPLQSMNVGLRVDHPRISDLVFHLISPDGTRYLLMDNRGGTTTNGAGTTVINTNVIPASHNGGPEAVTNTFDTGVSPGTINITYDFFNLPDSMQVFNGGILLTNTGLISGSGTFSLNYSGSTIITIIMNQGGNTNNPSTAWNYTVSAPQSTYRYLNLTEDTNKTTVPIKFAVPPFVPMLVVPTNVFVDGFEGMAATNYVAGQPFNGWVVQTNQVSLVTDTNLAFEGSNFLALASGSISRTLPTAAGHNYTLTFTYRGPGIVSLWRGENGIANDSINSNDGIPSNISYPPAEVGQGFAFDGTSSSIKALANSSMNVGQGGGFTLDLWVKPVDIDTRLNQALLEWNNNFGNSGTHLFLSRQSLGDLYANIVDTTGATHDLWTAGGIMATGSLQHVALTYNKATGTAVLYRNGTAVTNQNLGTFTPRTSYDLYFGTRPSGLLSPAYYNGLEDEVSIYNRDLSASEINAIFQKGSAGKFDAAAPFPANLAEAQATVSGSPSAVLSGANNIWQTYSTTFVAPQNGTPFSITGLQPGILLDNFILTEIPGNLYYLPEESLEPLLGLSAQGLWQLEIQDDRAGAGLTNTLVSWQLETVYAKTNFATAPVFTNTPASQTNVELVLLTVADGATNATPGLNRTYSLIDPPTGATINANGLFSWRPSEAQGPGVYSILVLVTDNNNPPLTATNGFTVTVLESNLPPVIVFPTTNNVFHILETVSYTNNAIATDPDLPANQLTFALVSGPAGLAVSTNGVISWTPDETNGPSTNIVTFSVTDLNPYTIINPQSFSVTNSFTIIVDESNLPPTLFLPADTNINEQVAWSAQATATDPDIPANPLTFAKVSGPAGLTVSTSGLISWTPTEAQGPGSYTVFVSVTDTNPPAVNRKSFSVTNSFVITVSEVNLAPTFLLTPPDTNILELTKLTVTNSAVDNNLPANPLTYSLYIVSTNLADPPVTNASISTKGVITWTPTESQGPGVYLVYTVATDSDPLAVNATSLSTTNVFTLTINEVNTRPFWPTNTATNYIVVAGYNFVLTNSAQDSDIPTNVLTYQLLSGPLGAGIDPNTGVITWQSTVADAGSNYIFTTVVTDTNVDALVNKSLSATNKFTVNVVATNTAPFWIASIVDQTFNELETNTFTVAAKDNDLPPNTLTYSLANAPAGMTITKSGFQAIIRWVPTEAQGPSNYFNILMIVSDNVTPPLFATNSFNVTVNEVNSAPKFILTPANRTVTLGTTLVVTNAATDSDIPTNLLFYSLLNPPAGASVDTNGVLTLTLPLGTNVVRTVVTDTNPAALVNKSLSATNSFNVIVTPPANIFISSITATNGGYLLTWTAPTNFQFQVRWTTNLAAPINWAVFPNTNTSTTTNFSYLDTNSVWLLKFYQLLLLP
jgi:subtilisin-like proprotein convertase family protein